MITEWPSLAGGGSGCVHRIILQIQRILSIPFQLNLDEKELNVIAKEFHGLDIIPLTINSFRYMPKEHYTIPMTLLSKLLINIDHYCQQFYKYNGL